MSAQPQKLVFSVKQKRIVILLILKFVLTLSVVNQLVKIFVVMRQDANPIRHVSALFDKISLGIFVAPKCLK